MLKIFLVFGLSFSLFAGSLKEFNNETLNNIPIVLSENIVIVDSKISEEKLKFSVLVNRKYDFKENDKLNKFKKLMNVKLEEAMCYAFNKNNEYKDLDLIFSFKTYDKQLFDININLSNCVR